MNAVDCRAVSVTRGDVIVVDQVDLTVPQGSWLSLVGPNGAGKTTLLHALAGLVDARGQLRVGGVDPARASRRDISRAIALMPQRPTVPPGTSVRQLISLGRTPYIRPFRTESAQDRAVVESVLGRLDLRGLGDRAVAALSGGELQRVMLARALAQQPRVLLLDEPTSALDIGHQQAVLDLVEDLRVSDGITVVAAMHDLTVAARYGRRMLLMDAGRAVAQGTPAHVLDAALLQRVYGARVEVLHRPAGVAVIPLGAAEVVT